MSVSVVRSWVGPDERSSGAVGEPRLPVSSRPRSRSKQSGTNSSGRRGSDGVEGIAGAYGAIGRRVGIRWGAVRELLKRKKVFIRPEPAPGPSPHRVACRAHPPRERTWLRDQACSKQVPCSACGRRRRTRHYVERRGQL